MKYVIAAIVFATLLALAPLAQADGETRECTTSTGSYGQSTTTCKILGETVTVKHEVSKVDTGIGDLNFYSIAAILIAGSAAFFGFSKLAERTYWFD